MPFTSHGKEQRSCVIEIETVENLSSILIDAALRPDGVLSSIVGAHLGMQPDMAAVTCRESCHDATQKPWCTGPQDSDAMSLTAMDDTAPASRVIKPIRPNPLRGST
jgi:hypothetical protein